jgi:DNA-binding CsgD family transcriptional regulator
MRRGEAGKRRDTQLSRAEIRVLCLIAEGLTDAEIATRLGRSPDTIHSHCQHLFAKTRTHNRRQLTRYAVAAGLVPSTWERTEIEEIT